MIRKLNLPAVLVLVSAGCPAAKGPGVGATTQTDRLLGAYSEIQNGRLLIIADFEDEKQMGIFRLEGASNPGRLTRDIKSGRAETGAGALAVTFSSPSEAVVVSSPPQSEWFLKRDWRPYDLFMMAVQSPRTGLTLETKIVGGVSGQAVQTVTETTLAVGWNFLRFDLAEMGEQVPLDDIQEIRLSLMDVGSEPVTLLFDDMLLAGNRRDLMGDSTNQAGSLYVQSAGRHWNVGAGGKFEISLRNGQVTRWFNLSADAYRLRNLVRGASLGPVPVRVEEPGRVLPMLDSDTSIQARQRILEMNPVRVVVECVWEVSGGQGSSVLFHSIYTIYPTGQIFVITSCGAGTPANAWAVHLGWSSGAPRVQVGTVEGTGGQASLPYATAHMADAEAALLVVPYPDAPKVSIAEFSDSATKTTALVLRADPTGAGSLEALRCELVLGVPALLNEAKARATDYLAPGGVQVEIGKPAGLAVLRSDGYDPGTGTYRVHAEEHRARMVVEGKKRPVFSPALLVEGGSEKEAWVYVNYLIHQPVVREPSTAVLFQIPQVVSKQVVVEPLFTKGP